MDSSRLDFSFRETPKTPGLGTQSPLLAASSGQYASCTCCVGFSSAGCPILRGAYRGNAIRCEETEGVNPEIGNPVESREVQVIGSEFDVRFKAAISIQCPLSVCEEFSNILLGGVIITQRPENGVSAPFIRPREPIRRCNRSPLCPSILPRCFRESGSSGLEVAQSTGVDRGRCLDVSQIAARVPLQNSLCFLWAG